jgi:hypothetical protein
MTAVRLQNSDGLPRASNMMSFATKAEAICCGNALELREQAGWLHLGAAKVEAREAPFSVNGCCVAMQAGG